VLIGWFLKVHSGLTYILGHFGWPKGLRIRLCASGVIIRRQGIVLYISRINANLLI